MTASVPVFWGHGAVEPYRAHIRETVGDQPVGRSSICGFALVAEVTDEQLASDLFLRCSRCLELLANRRPGVDYPLWAC